MSSTAGTILTSRNAKVTPTARASMLVATARVSMVLNPKEASGHSSSLLKDSFIMLAPITASSTKAIQWSMFVIMD